RAYRPSWARPERRQTPPGRAPSWADRAFDRTAPCGRETSRDCCSAEYPRGSPPSPGKSLETHPYRSPLRQSFRILPGEERLESLFRGGLLCLLLALAGAGSDDHAVALHLHEEALIVIGAGFAGERIVNDLILFPLHQLLEHGFAVKIAG